MEQIGDNIFERNFSFTYIGASKKIIMIIIILYTQSIRLRGCPQRLWTMMNEHMATLCIVCKKKLNTRRKKTQNKTISITQSAEHY